MVFMQPHKLLILSGALYVEERWSIGIRFTRGPGFEDEASQQAECDLMANVASQWFAAQQVIGINANLDLVKWNMIGSDGKYVYPFTSLTEYTTPISSGGGTGGQVPQVAVAVTLETGVQRGLAARGRVYLPNPVATVGSAGFMTTTQRDAISTAMKTLLDDLNAVNPEHRAVVCSSVGTGMERPITAVATGRVLDTIRSRRTSFKEDRVPVLLAAPS